MSNTRVPRILPCGLGAGIPALASNTRRWAPRALSEVK